MEALAVATVLAAAIAIPHSGQAGRGRQQFLDSAYLEDVPEPGPCDVVITTSNHATTLPMLNDPSKYVFCIAPGNYRSLGHIGLRTKGTATRRRYFRYHGPSPTLPAIQQTDRAVLHGLIINEASWWVVDGITIQPTAQDASYLVAIFGSTRNVLQNNLIDASLQNNYKFQNGIVFGATGSASAAPGTPSTANTIQHNVLRGGNKNRLPVDYAGVNIPVESVAGAHNDNNKVLDNEIYDWGDGVQVSSNDDLCQDAAWPRGTVIDGNDIYITSAKRVRCSAARAAANGECSCAENGIDIKVSAGSSPSRWTRVINNRLWGFRPTLRDVPSCGGSGSRGQAITSGNACAGYVFVARNVIMDSAVGIITQGEEWRVVGNLFYEIRTADEGNGNRGLAIYPLEQNDALVQFNTVVASDNAYNDAGSGVLTQCNAVIHDAGVNGLQSSRGSNHVTRYNHAYESYTPDFAGSTNKVYPNDNQSRNRQLCFYRKRWTDSEEVCIPFGETSLDSPHANPPADCASDIGADFGLPALSYP